MLRPGQTAEAQNKMVYNTLSSLLTPVMPPIYRTFMSGTYWQQWLGSSFGGSSSKSPRSLYGR